MSENEQFTEESLEQALLRINELVGQKFIRPSKVMIPYDTSMYIDRITSKAWVSYCRSLKRRGNKNI